ncbi:helix-turn-helix domain-containing protein [Nocardia tengchongensis]
MSDSESTLTRRQLGRYLKSAREEAGFTLEQAGRQMDWSKSKLQRHEAGEVAKIRRPDLDLLIRLYQIDDRQAAHLHGLAETAAGKSWWHEFSRVLPEDFRIYVDMESAAAMLTTYQPDLIPGLVQTRPYARVLAYTANPEDGEAALAGRLELKTRRQRILTHNLKKPQLNMVLGETVLRRVIGGPKIMADQLKRLAEASTLPNVTLRILPFSAGMPTGDQTGPFVIIDFGPDGRGQPIAPTTIYSEGYSSDMYSEKRDVVDRYIEAYRVLQRAALDESSSRDLVREIAREYSA